MAGFNIMDPSTWFSSLGGGSSGGTTMNAPQQTNLGFSPGAASGADGGMPGASPTLGGPTSGLGSSLGFNIGTGQLAASGLSALAGLWNAYNSNSLANKSFNLNKELLNTNLANQTQAYNTNLTGMETGRAAQENQTPAQALDFINANKLQSKTL